MEYPSKDTKIEFVFVFKHFCARFVTIANYLFKNFLEKFNIGMEKAKFHADSKFFRL